MQVLVEPMAALRAEHTELLPSIDALRRAAYEIGDASPDTMRREVDEALGFLQGHLLPHAVAEDEVLYPAIERLMAAPGATATMRRDHEEVVRLTDDLAETRRELATDVIDATRARVIGLLHSLHAIVALHFAKEEEIYVPLLNAGLTVHDAEELFGQMESAAERYRAGHR